MLRLLKRTALRMAVGGGVVTAFARSDWRRRRLLILCYHGLSLADEHNWRALYVTQAFFRRRLEILARRGYRVLPLGTAAQMLREGSLPPQAVAITFDDGFYDFYRLGFPVLRQFGFPATVYQTTYYCDHPYPIYNLVLSYLFWRGAGRRLDAAPFGVDTGGAVDLTPSTDAAPIVQAFLDGAARQGLSPAGCNDVAAGVAAQLGVDYSEILRLRMLQLMNSREIAEIAAAGSGIDVQLHTHRHRTPLDERLFLREIDDNRRWLEAIAPGAGSAHFCYPSGQYRAEFLPWLRARGVVTSTTCDHGIALASTEPLLLPRFLDSMNVPEMEFESWLSGFSTLLPRR